MNINIDTIIFITFLILNLSVGLWYGVKTTKLKDYAIGGRNFSTATLAATVVATWISGSFFTNSVSETYKEGVWYVSAALGDIFALSITAIFLAPRIAEFFDSLSVAEVMGKLYGTRVRMVTAVCSIANSIGMTSMQIKVFSTIFSHFLAIPNLLATLISSFVVVTYSAVGGIRAVTFTDALQFITFGVSLPILAIFVWKIFGDTEMAVEVFQNNPNFDYHQLFNYENPKFWPSIFLFFFFAVPGLNSTMFQRMLMARDTDQIRKSFLIGACMSFVLRIIAGFIALAVLCHNPNLPPNNVAMYVIDNYAFTGLKGIAIVGIMAMIMSTADSWINTGSVIFAHDLCKPMGLEFKNELFLARLFAILTGCFALILALSSTDLLKLLLLQGKFYKPIVMPPLLFAILGFRSTTKAVGIGMGAAVLSIFVWLNYITPYTGIDGIMPSVATNMLAFVGAHYLLRQPGGWIKRKPEPKEYPRGTWSDKILSKSSSEIKADFFAYCSKCLPQNELVYIYFAFVILLGVVVSLGFQRELYMSSFVAITTMQVLSLLISTMFFCNKLWPENFKEKYIGLIWQISIFFVLAFNSSFLLIMSDFSQTAIIMFILNLTMIGLLLNWQSSLIMSILGGGASCFLYTFAVGEIPNLSSASHDPKLKIAYIVVMVSGFMLAFLKPKQEYQNLIEEKNDHLADSLAYKNEELESASMIKEEFIRNATHEYHAPMTGLISTLDVLYNSFDTFSLEDIKDGLKNAYDSSHKLRSLDDNIVTLSQLAKPKYKLKNELIDFSEFVIERVEKCRKLYEKEKTANKFILDIKHLIVTRFDRKYGEQLLDNLIINSIQYCSNGTVEISVRKHGPKDIEFIIKDDGIGIPIRELYDIFSPFTVSSKTKTPAGGRGVGLAVCKRVLEVYGGTIAAQSDGIKGASFRFILPRILH